MKRNLLFFLSVIAGTITIMSLGCKTVVDPELTTNGVSQISQTTAVSGGNITFDGNAKVTARGVCCGKDNTPDLGDIVTSDGKGIGAFVSNISGLTPNTTYYVRAYASNKQGTGYGSPMIFKTLP